MLADTVSGVGVHHPGSVQLGAPPGSQRSG